MLCVMRSSLPVKITSTLVRITSFACSSGLCIRNRKSLILCLVCDGGCVAMFTTKTDPEMVAIWAVQAGSAA